MIVNIKYLFNYEKIITIFFHSIRNIKKVEGLDLHYDVNSTLKIYTTTTMKKKKKNN